MHLKGVTLLRSVKKALFSGVKLKLFFILIYFFFKFLLKKSSGESIAHNQRGLLLAINGSGETFEEAREDAWRKVEKAKLFEKKSKK